MTADYTVIGRKIHWWAENHLSKEECFDAQVQAEYHPDGYGGPHGIKHFTDEHGADFTTWFCSASCD